MDVGQTVVPSLELESQLFMVYAKTVQNRSVQIVYVYGVLRNIVAVAIRLPMRYPRLDSASRHPDGEAARMMIAAIVVPGQFPLAIDRPAKLTSPHDERIPEHVALLQVFD